MSDTLLSLVIPTIATTPFLARAVSSAVRQDHPFDEIVLFGNGIDEQALRTHLGPLGNAVRIVTTPLRLAPHASWNAAVAAAKDGHVLILGDDDELLPNAGGAARRLLAWGGFGTLGFENMDSRGQPAERCVPAEEWSTVDQFYHRLYIEGITLMLPGTVFAKRLFQDCGGFRPTPFKTGWFIDTDCWMRLAARAGGARHDRDVSWRYRVNQGQLGFSADLGRFARELDAYLVEHEQMALECGIAPDAAFGGSRERYRVRVLAGRLASSLRNRIMNGDRLQFADLNSVVRVRELPWLEQLRVVIRVARWSRQFHKRSKPTSLWNL